MKLWTEVTERRPRSNLAIRPAEQVAHGLPTEQGPPASPLMLWPVVDHVTALAKGREVRAGVVRCVMVAVGSRQDHPRRTDRAEHIVVAYRSADDPPCPVPPGSNLRVLPASVTEVIDLLAMRTPADLTARPTLRKRITSESWGRLTGYMAEKCVAGRMR